MLNQDRACSSLVTVFDQLGTLRHLWMLLVAIAWTLGPDVAVVKGQTYLQSVGSPAFSTKIPVEMGYIDASNGRLHLEIPMASYPQRAGRPYNVALMYDSAIWTCCTAGTWQPTNVSTANGGSNSWSGWRYVGSSLQNSGSLTYTEWQSGWCNLFYDKQDNISNWTYTSPDGTVHSFPTVWTGFPSDDCPANDVPNSSGWASDGSGFWLSVNNYYYGAVYAPDGTHVDGNDSNGNNFSSGGDFEGRMVTSTVNGSTITYTFPNAQGNTASTYTVTTATINAKTNFGQSGATECTTSCTLTVVRSITLPDNSMYSFQYDCDKTVDSTDCSSPGGQTAYYGLLTVMDLPTGGQITYAWSPYTDSQGNHYQWISKRITPDSGTGWTYTPHVVTTCGVGQVNCQQTFTMQKPSGDTVVYTFALNGGAWKNQVQGYTGSASSGTLLSTVSECWNFVTITSGVCQYNTTTSNPATGVQKMAESTTWPVPSGSAITKTTQYTYDGYGNTTKIQENNFYIGTLPTRVDRTTTINYLNSTNYINALILNRPTSVTVTNSSGGTVAQTLFSYDGSTLASATGMSNHDDTNYGTSNSVRGNVTQIQRLISGSTYLTTSMTYDMTGQVRTTTDSNGNVTQYDYTDNFYTDPGNGQAPTTKSVNPPTNAYLKTITYPTINSVTMTKTFGYYWGAGQVALSTDENSNTSYFHFYDSLNRPTSTALPNSGWIYNVYPSGSETQVDIGTGVSSPTLSISCPTSGNACRHDQILTDGLGRTIHQNLVSDSGGQTSVDTGYDSNGRVYSVSNPHRSGSSSTDGTEYYAYDGLDRVILVTRADGSVAHTYYGTAAGSNGGLSTQLCSGYGIGYPILSVDEAGLKRQTWTDGFGRLVETDEPNSGGTLSVPTCYSYDLNNNLTAVLQSGSRQRTFIYDSLSRLTQATNPESGTINYTYDANSNVRTKTAPAPNQTGSATVTTTYGYDALNRLTAKNYSDTNTPAPTAPVSFLYDQSSSWGPITNPKGRLTTMYAGSGATQTGAEYSYDAVGRTVLYAQCYPSNCGSGSYNTTYTYDLAGNMLSASNGVGTATISYSYDSAGRPGTVTSSFVDSQHPATLATFDSTLGYWPHGAFQKLTLGNGLTEATVYNNRLQPCHLNMNSSSGTLSTCTSSLPAGNVQDFNYGYNWGTSDSGNVITWNGTGKEIFTRSYTYDTLNRLWTLSDSTSGNPCPGLSWSYDAWGNRTAQTVTSGSCGPWSAGYNTLNQITNSGFQYDAAGNLIADGSHHYYYDAEGRIIQLDGTLGTCSSATMCYVYDANGVRVRSTGPSGASEWIHDLQGNVVSQWIVGYGWGRGYVYLGRQLLAEYGDGTTYFVQPDHLGSTRVQTNATGGVHDSLDFLPFGEQIGGDTGTTHKFTGKERDSESGLDYFGARYMSSQHGGFMSPDPLDGDITDPQTLNRYAYVRDNPVNSIDPSGLITCTDVGCPPSDPAPPPDPGGANVPGVIYLPGYCWASIYGPFCSRGAIIPPKTPSQVKPPAPKPQTNCSHGFGIGVQGGATAAAGLKSGGVITGQAGGGAFVNSSGHPSVGGYASGAIAGRLGNSTGGFPAQSLAAPWVGGAYAGYGPGIFITNAGSVAQLGGPFAVLNVDIGIGIGKASIQLAVDNNGTVFFTINGGPAPYADGFGFDVSGFTSNTKTVGTGCKP